MNELKKAQVYQLEETLNNLLNQLDSGDISSSLSDLLNFNTDSNILTLLLKEDGAKRLSSRHLTSGFHPNDRIIDLIIRYGYWTIPRSAKHVYNVIHDLNLWDTEATVNTISDLSRMGAKTVRKGLIILRRNDLISRRLNKDGNRIYEYSIKPPNPHDLHFKKALNRMSN